MKPFQRWLGSTLSDGTRGFGRPARMGREREVGSAGGHVRMVGPGYDLLP